MSFFGDLSRRLSLARDPMVSEIFESIQAHGQTQNSISFEAMQNYIAHQYSALQGAPDASEEAQSIGKRGAHLCFRAAGRKPTDQLTYSEFERWYKVNGAPAGFTALPETSGAPPVVAPPSAALSSGGTSGSPAASAPIYQARGGNGSTGSFCSLTEPAAAVDDALFHIAIPAVTYCY